MYHNRFTTGDYKVEFEKAVDEILTLELPIPWRNKAVHDVTEAYIEQTGKRPDNVQLQRLADYILRDDSRNPDKVTQTEYPIMSEQQLQTRMNREIVVGDLAYQPSAG